jgi:uncharacterized protein
VVEHRQDGYLVAMAGRTAEECVRLPLLEAAWIDIAFLHWPVPPEMVQALLPAGLVVDEFDGAAWVGLTPFTMAAMRPPGLPEPIPTRLSRLPLVGTGARVAGALTSTHETNLRTYARGPDGRDGLWFLSLEINSAPLAVLLRAAVGAPYHHARLTIHRTADTLSYQGSRVGGSQAYSAVIRPRRRVTPTRFEDWLTGRWRAYTVHFGRLLATPVAHEPWPLQEAELQTIEHNLTDVPELHGDPPVVHYSTGVHRVRIGVPRVIRSGA